MASIATTHKVFLLGATGGIGSQVLKRLLDRGCKVTIIVRNTERLSTEMKDHPSLTVIEEPSGHLSLTNETFQKHVQCDAIVQCLGHNLSFKGLFGHPRRLCADTVKRLCDAVMVVAPRNPIKLIVINTEGVERPDGEDRKTLRRGCCESCVLCFLKYCLPPHADNIDTSVYLHNEVQNNPYVDFCAVRPSDLIDGLPTEFTVHETLQNGIFNAGTTLRSNVGEFMANLVTDSGVWNKWKNTYPHILDVKTTADDRGGTNNSNTADASNEKKDR